MKNAVVLTLFSLAGIGVLYFAWRQGEDRQTFEYFELDKEVPIPLLFDWMAGTAELLQDHRIRTHLGAVMLPEKTTKPYMRCIGFFKPSDTTYYLLESDGVIYVEKEQFVEPLIYALYNLERGPSNKPPPASARDAITLLPDDFGRLVKLAAKIRAKPASEKNSRQ